MTDARPFASIAVIGGGMTKLSKNGAGMLGGYDKNNALGLAGSGDVPCCGEVWRQGNAR